MKSLNRLHKTLIYIFLLPVVCFITIYANYQIISISVSDEIYYELRDVPRSELTLVLGSGIVEHKNWVNLTLVHRLVAAQELYLNHKTIKIITSGSTRIPNNDEPGDMKRHLIDNGVAETDIILDTAGFRTWKSVEAIKLYYPDKQIIITSQKEHLERALFISKFLGINAIGYVAESSPGARHYGAPREYLARIRCTIDCLKYLFNPN
jgi:SanA protein